MKKVLILLIGLLIAVSCQKDFYLEDLLNTQELLANSRASHKATANELNALLDDANEEIAQLADLITVANAELMTSESENEVLVKQIAGLTSDLERLQIEASSMKLTIEQIQMELEEELAKNDVDDALIAHLAAELVALQEAYAELVANPIVEIQVVVEEVIQQVEVIREVIVEVVVQPTHDVINSILEDHPAFTIHSDGNVTIEGVGIYTVDVSSNGTYDIIDPQEEFVNVASYIEVLKFFISQIPVGDGSSSEELIAILEARVETLEGTLENVQTQLNIATANANQDFERIQKLTQDVRGLELLIDDLDDQIDDLLESQVIITNDPYDTVSSTTVITTGGGVETSLGEGSAVDTELPYTNQDQFIMIEHRFVTVHETSAVVECTTTTFELVINGHEDATPPEVPQQTQDCKTIVEASRRETIRLVTSQTENPNYEAPETAVATPEPDTTPAAPVDLGPHTVTTAQRIFPGWSHIVVDEDLSDITGVTGVIVIIDGKDYNYRLDTSRAINPQWDGGVTNIHLNRLVDLDIPRGTVFTVEFIK